MCYIYILVIGEEDTASVVFATLLSLAEFQLPQNPTFGICMLSGLYSDIKL